ncbi:olfactory receptor 6B1-like [Gastrophryne carolinensis]
MTHSVFKLCSAISLRRFSTYNFKMNTTVVTDFILLAFSDLYQLQYMLFFVLLLTYITCIIGNISIILLVKTHSSLHTPMYFFISAFSLTEVTFVSVTVPKLLSSLVSDNNMISFIGCFTQMYVFVSLGLTECCLLAVMVFDRHLAINSPLHYSTVMSPSLCSGLAVFPGFLGFGSSLVTIMFTAKLSFCGPNVINHFFCDLAPIQKLSCSDPIFSITSTVIVTLFVIVLPFLIIIGLYTRIIITVCSIKSTKGKQKAFSTCSSHLIVVSLIFGTAIIMYINPKGSNYDKYLAFMYTAITPTVNPFIYTFRNQDVKKVLRNSINFLKLRT